MFISLEDWCRAWNILFDLYDCVTQVVRLANSVRATVRRRVTFANLRIGVVSFDSLSWFVKQHIVLLHTFCFYICGTYTEYQTVGMLSYEYLLLKRVSTLTESIQKCLLNLPLQSFVFSEVKLLRLNQISEIQPACHYLIWCLVDLLLWKLFKLLVWVQLFELKLINLTT